MNKTAKNTLIIVIALLALGAGTCVMTGFDPIAYFACDAVTGVGC